VHELEQRNNWNKEIIIIIIIIKIHVQRIIQLMGLKDK